MKLIFIAIFVSISSLVFAQDTVQLKKVTELFNNALLTKDTNLIKQLVHKQISYGHSNGWLQTKQDLITDFATGKIEYTKIEEGEKFFTKTKQAIAVRNISKVEGVVNGYVFSMSLQVLQVWKKVKKNWVLLARQSVKVN
ncbi:MAG TPA: nuclear transport factor 2 family protein [Chitinophagaceae bacterium]|jgi:hypothetical protein|nr:nuclear transport factor 2 family protein [Chitinophagaceae bacterium]HPH24631.1 nuclear transport factor 2 family protein [Chitinophagaceae bacterium]